MKRISRYFDKFYGRLRSVSARLGRKRPLHPAVQEYVRFNQELWGPPRFADSEAVMLVGIYRYFPCMPGYAHLANHLAGKSSAAIEWFNFYSRDPEIEAIYSSFGAAPGLSRELVPIDEEAALQTAREIFSQLRTKWDVIEIKVDGMRIGDLIYDTYLRTGPYATVDLQDPQLEQIIHQAVQISRVCRAYFAKRKVIGVLPDHFPYIYSGIVTRCAFFLGVPVYQIFYGPNFLTYSLSAPPGSNNPPARSPFAFFPKTFARLTPEEQASGREKGRTIIERRLAGYVDGLLTAIGSIYGAPVIQTAYSQGSAEPVLKTTGRPRILVLMHDFCDAVHIYRSLLFPDFYEWIDFLCRKASETEFDWYIKAHPNTARDGAVADVSRRVMDELQAKYPRINFLKPTTSSLQIVKEGVSAMFTCYGTAAHEFAYFGIPVVNAGDNPHIAYSFNLHPKTVEEYAEYIAHADALPVTIRKEDVEEYVYMNYAYKEEKLSSDANPMSAEFLASDEYLQERSRPETLKMLMHRPSPEEQQELTRYFDHIPHVSEPFSLDVRAGKN